VDSRLILHICPNVDEARLMLMDEQPPTPCS